VNPWQRLRYVTLPNISPVLMFAAITGVIAALQYFTEAVVAASVASGQATTGGGNAALLGYPEGSTLTYAQWLYVMGFKNYYLYASALAVVIPVVARRHAHPCAARAACTARRAPDDHADRAQSLRRRGPSRTGTTTGALDDAAVGLGRPRGRHLPGDRLPVAVRLHLQSMMTSTQALTGDSGRRVENYADFLTKAPMLTACATPFTLRSHGAHARVEYSRGVRAFGCVGAAATPRCRRPHDDDATPQVTQVPRRDWSSAPHRHAVSLICPNLLGDAFSIFLLRQFFLTILRSRRRRASTAARSGA
jgi:hypothetical protein